MSHSAVHVQDSLCNAGVRDRAFPRRGRIVLSAQAEREAGDLLRPDRAPPERFVS